MFEIRPKFKDASWTLNSEKVGAQPKSWLPKFTPNWCLILDQYYNKKKTVSAYIAVKCLDFIIRLLQHIFTKYYGYLGSKFDGVDWATNSTKMGGRENSWVHWTLGRTPISNTAKYSANIYIIVYIFPFNIYSLYKISRYQCLYFRYVTQFIQYQL